jgi:hypothetical protein
MVKHLNIGIRPGRDSMIPAERVSRPTIGTIALAASGRNRTRDHKRFENANFFSSSISLHFNAIMIAVPGLLISVTQAALSLRPNNISAVTLFAITTVNVIRSPHR